MKNDGHIVNILTGKEMKMRLGIVEKCYYMPMIPSGLLHCIIALIVLF